MSRRIFTARLLGYLVAEEVSNWLVAEDLTKRRELKDNLVIMPVREYEESILKES